MKRLSIILSALLIFGCTNTKETSHESISFEFQTGILLPEFYASLDKINELIRGYKLPTDSAFKQIPYDENIPLIDQIDNYPTDYYTNLDEFHKDYPFNKYFYPNSSAKGELLNSPILGFSKAADTTIVTNYIEEYSDSLHLSESYCIEWIESYRNNDLLALTIFQSSSDRKEIVGDELLKSISCKVNKQRLQDGYELLIEFEPSVRESLTFENSIPVLLTFSIDEISYSTSTTMNELASKDYKISFCDNLPEEELKLISTNYDIVKL